MKKYLALCLLMFAVVSSCKKKPEQTIAETQKKCNEINHKLKDLTIRQADYFPPIHRNKEDSSSLGGWQVKKSNVGSITGYFRDDEIKKIVGERFADKHRTFTEYYFDDGMLIFVNEQHYAYNRPMLYTEEVARRNNDSEWYDDKKTKLRTSGYFFNKNKMIKWVSNDGEEVKQGTPDFIEMESILWGEAAILLKQLKEPQNL